MFFESSKPVTGKYFFDRDKELEELLSAIPRIEKGATTYIALLGHRKVGKTSLLQKFLEEASGRVLTVKIDCWEKENPSLEFFQSYLVKVIDAVLINLEIPLSIEAALLNKEKTLKALVDIKNLKIKALEPGIDALISISEGRYNSSVISSIIDLPEKLAIELKTYFFVVIDEFQEIENLNKFKDVKNNIGNMYSFLRTKWQAHKRVNYFVAGSKITLMKTILTRKNSPFFQHFKIIEIRCFPENEAKKMLKIVSSKIKKEIPSDLILKIIDIFGTNPFYLQIVGEELCRNDLIDEDALKITVQEILFNRSGRLYLYFEDMLGKYIGNSASLENSLIAIAKQEGTLTQKAKELGITTGALKTWLKRVPDLIEQTSDIYKIKDQALGLWLKNRSDLSQTIPTTVLGNEAEKLVAKVLSEIGFQLIYQSQASRGAFDLLGIITTQKIGIQVKKGKFPFYIKAKEINEMKFWAKELSWKPVLAVVFYDKCFFYDAEKLKQHGAHFKVEEKTPYIKNMLKFAIDR